MFCNVIINIPVTYATALMLTVTFEAIERRIEAAQATGFYCLQVKVRVTYHILYTFSHNMSKVVCRLPEPSRLVEFQLAGHLIDYASRSKYGTYIQGACSDLGCTSIPDCFSNESKT
jgi:hypothetical protein